MQLLAKILGDRAPNADKNLITRKYKQLSFSIQHYLGERPKRMFPKISNKEKNSKIN